MKRRQRADIERAVVAVRCCCVGIQGSSGVGNGLIRTVFTFFFGGGGGLFFKVLLLFLASLLLRFFHACIF